MLSEIDEFAANVRTAVASGHTIIVDGFPFEAAAAIRVNLGSDEMLRLISVIKPKLLYIHESWFDCTSIMEDLLNDLGAADGDNVDISPLSALKRYGKEHDGQLCLVYLAFVFDDVLHLCLEEAEWYDAFQTDAADNMERLKSVLSDNRKNSDMQSALEVKRKATILANDPAFNHNRPSKEKRAYLAQQLFPECEDWEIWRIVEQATNIDYLVKARSSDS
jgi:hypothetical protein